MDLKLLKFQYIFKYFTLLLTFKALDHDYISGVFTLPNHRYNTRSAFDPVRPNPRLTIYQKSIFYKVPVLWSEYRRKIGDMNISLYTFKSKIRSILMTEQLSNEQ